ncbi:MAG: ABC transporter substrate-binding protein [Candidatus Diapherotrites archaeon]|nr:ABC transporter substrate-binding protein [Candidatus Diapherotrites archaeon]
MNRSLKLGTSAAVVIALVLVLGLSFFAYNNTGYLTLGVNAEKDNTVKIGFIAPLSGPAASTGISSRQGFELANELFPEVNGKKIQVIFEDDKADPAVSLTAAKKLVELDGARVLVEAFSGPALAVLPYISEKGVLLASSLAATPKLNGEGKNFFRLVPSSVKMATNAAKVVNEKGFSKFAVLYEINDYSIGWKDSFISKTKELGGEVVIEESFNSQDTDLRGQLEKIRSSGANALVVSVLSSVSAAKVLKQANELGLNIQIIGNEAFGFNSVAVANKGIAEGVIVSEYKFDSNSKETKAFLAAYHTKYSQAGESDIYAALGYDTYNALREGIAKCGSDNSCITFFVKNRGVNYGAVGAYTIDINGDAQREVALHVIRDGRLEEFK